ncbi:hypothetical protein HMPREF9318_01712 [Streptococcus urinalis FB127-CNA-2]|uniref:Basic membrane protein n=1 Tax=Streptococcus urinalis 2285-97 TaxID=764291 RepID=G5KED4_9STRE|nr:BMP family protein [Streptococcus urinalis]EHJ57342.1 basic membrane protein [Streptococcus urinalis 2285-97]EKS18213.1 hypothetical protein HMPREF9318_01712 [Streptococcus urinalis FB127-CNA-2]VEF32912.1 basic membrane family protein [Streptococcus urinalis]
MTKRITVLSALVCSTILLGSCSKRVQTNQENHVKVAMLTNQTGVDDKSFNQSAWTGLQKWAKRNHYQKGRQFDYFQSSNESEFATSINTAIASHYNLVFGIGFPFHDTIEKAAKEHKDRHFAIIDDVIPAQKNSVSIRFADNEAAYLAGVAAAKTTKTNQVGFIGGMESAVIKRFEKGYLAGVKSINSSINVRVTYLGSFSDAAKGKSIAATQYASGIDVIYQAAGASGAGIINEAKSENETRLESNKVWVIGCDSDQSSEGQYLSKDHKKANFILASSIKEVGSAIIDIIHKSKKNQFPSGKTLTYGIKESGVDLKGNQLSSDTKQVIEAAKQKIKEGQIIVPVN